MILSARSQPVTQGAAEHLPHGVPGKVVDENDRRRPLVVDQVLGAVGFHPTLVDPRSSVIRWSGDVIGPDMQMKKTSFVFTSSLWIKT